MKSNLCQEENLIIKKVLRSHTLRLSVNRLGQVILRIPFFCSRQIALDFVQKNREWIEKQKANRPSGLTFKDGQTLSVLGKNVRICHDPNRHFATHIQDGTLFVAGDINFLNRRVTDFIRNQTAQYIQVRASELAGKINRSVNRICLKDTTSRWGSCSGKNNLNFCWRLGMAPIFVLDYIIAHEVSHLKEMNHSPRFWQTVSTLCDRRSDAEIWLRRNGHTLR